MAKTKVDHYKSAPTWLYRAGESKLFTTQEAVDQAWKEGWHGPGDSYDAAGPLSLQTFETKGDLKRAVADVYPDLTINTSRAMATCMERVRNHEIDLGIIEGDKTGDESDQTEE